MKLIIKKLATKMIGTDEGKRHYEHILDMQKTEGFKLFTEFYMKELIEEMARELLSEDFSKQPGPVKDAKQRAYSMTYEIIKFFIDPIQEVRKYAELKNKNYQSGPTKERGRK